MSRSLAMAPFNPLVGLMNCTIPTKRKAVARLEKVLAPALRCRISLLNRSKDYCARVSVHL